MQSRAKEIRISRLFDGGPRAVIVAADHGQTLGPVEGVRDFPAAMARLKGADGVLMAPYMSSLAGDLFYGKNAPTMVLRLNWCTGLALSWGYAESRTVSLVTVEEALALGADIVLANLTLLTGNEATDAENAQVFGRIVADKERFGVPLIGEVFPADPLRLKLSADEWHTHIKTVVRIAVELGADMIKTYYTGDRWHEVCEGVQVPVFGLGSEKTPRSIDALELARREIAAGGRGVVFGRNVIQHSQPDRFLSALKEVVKSGVDPAEAVARFGLE
jgi:DhnA family fructose-bisphosphate aldolase class Ia